MSIENLEKVLRQHNEYAEQINKLETNAAFYWNLWGKEKDKVAFLEQQLAHLQTTLESVLDSWRCGENINEASSVYADAKALVDNLTPIPDKQE